jgi:N-ATPase, AtpR subunit
MTDFTAGSIALGALAGSAFGVLHFKLLWMSVEASVRRGGLMPWAAGKAFRLALLVAAGAALVATKAGALVMLSALAGFMGVRALVLARQKALLIGPRDGRP